MYLNVLLITTLQVCGSVRMYTCTSSRTVNSKTILIKGCFTKKDYSAHLFEGGGHCVDFHGCMILLRHLVLVGSFDHRVG